MKYYLNEKSVYVYCMYPFNCQSRYYVINEALGNLCRFYLIRCKNVLFDNYEGKQRVLFCNDWNFGRGT